MGITGDKKVETPDMPPAISANQDATATPTDLPVHLLAELFPPLQDPEFRDLVRDIKAHGLRSPLVTFNGAILDGSNRYRACIEAGVELVTQEYGGPILSPSCWPLICCGGI